METESTVQIVPKITSAACVGIEFFPVTVEVTSNLTLPPHIVIVGLPDQAIKESKDRIRSAITSSGFHLPAKTFIVNLAPADIRKEGPSFDLPIALGILAKQKVIFQESLKDFVFVGELSLDGKLRPVNGTLSIAMGLAGTEKTLVVPEENYEEASLQENISIIPAKSLGQIVECLSENKLQTLAFDGKRKKYRKKSFSVTFEDIKGQVLAKRALEIAISGGHNLLMLGPPGSGKTLLAKSIPSLLPKATHREFLDIVRIYSTRSTKTREFFERPFRAPHHTISAPAMAGSGANPKPGEISLSHNGVLFLDEFPEFPRHVLETLRGPLEDKTVTIARAKDIVTYPANFVLVCAMNPCPCGYLGDPKRECRCKQDQILKYLGKVSGPILDRIDIHIEVPRIKHSDLKSKESGETSLIVQERIENVRQAQNERYCEFGFHTNSELPPKLIEKFCELDKASEGLLDMAVKELHLSARAYHKILKLARTISDMESSSDIKERHIQEAIQYRSLDRMR